MQIYRVAVGSRRNHATLGDHGSCHLPRCRGSNRVNVKFVSCRFVFPVRAWPNTSQPLLAFLKLKEFFRSRTTLCCSPCVPLQWAAQQECNRHVHKSHPWFTLAFIWCYRFDMMRSKISNSFTRDGRTTEEQLPSLLPWVLTILLYLWAEKNWIHTAAMVYKSLVWPRPAIFEFLDLLTSRTFEREARLKMKSLIILLGIPGASKLPRCPVPNQLCPKQFHF